MTLQVSEHPPGNTSVIAILKIVMLYFLHFSTDQVAHLSLISRVAVCECDVALACVYTNAKSFYHRPMGTGPFVKTLKSAIFGTSSITHFISRDNAELQC